MKKAVSLLIIPTIILFAATLCAQSNFSVDLRIGAGLPQGEFKDNVENNGFGFTGDFLYHLSGSPLRIGGSLSYVIYGSDTRKEPFSYTIPDVFVDVTTTNSILMGNIILRIQTKPAPVMPYGEGLFGFSLLTTDTRIENEDNEEIASSNNLSDVTFNYGGGAGLKIRVYQNKETNRMNRGSNGISAAYIDINFRYIRGGEAEYLKEGSIRYENEKVVYDKKKSTTDINIITAGVTLSF